MNDICSNCMKVGHQQYNCKLPIQSYGIILFRINPETNEIEYLMIKRKDSFSYIDLIRGKYNQNNIEQLKYIIDDITLEEKERLINENYEYLRNILWLSELSPLDYKSEDLNAQRKFETIKNGIYNEEETIINLKKIIEDSSTQFIDQEWEFPKGRKNINEKDVECALREFEEETGYSRKDIKLYNNVIPYDEIFIGSNYRCYKHRYFVAYMDRYKDTSQNKYETLEVSKIEWKTYEDCIQSIRPKSIEKKTILKNVNTLLKTFFY